jgi:hypothetical protein
MRISMEFKKGYPNVPYYGNKLIILRSGMYRIFSTYTKNNYKLILKLVRLSPNGIKKYNRRGMDISLGSDLENTIKVLNESN